MTSKEKHQKHSKLEKPNYGEFGRNELAILGAPCGTIQKLANKIIEHLQHKYQFAYVDATHNSTADVADSKIASEYIVDGNKEHFTQNKLSNEYEIKLAFSNVDSVLINGNHFKGEAQIVIINNDKKESLLRKVDRLSNIQLIILDEGVEKPFEFIEEILLNQNVPIVSITDESAIFEFVDQKLSKNIPSILGLLLAGGKSSRMGKDKSLISYRNINQRQFCYDILNSHCEEVYLSVAKKWDEDKFDYDIIKDTFVDLGPFGGILSAFQKFPNNAILSLACDVPLIEESDIQYLVKHRNPSKVATAFFNPKTNFPEPLITIWEPKAYPLLLQYLALGYSCPRKILINSDIELVNIEDSEKLMNANTPEDELLIKEKIKATINHQ